MWHQSIRCEAITYTLVYCLQAKAGAGAQALVHFCWKLFACKHRQKYTTDEGFSENAGVAPVNEK